MGVVEGEPNTWYLLKEGERFLFRVVAADILIELNSNEAERYAAAGRPAADELASRITSNSMQYDERALPGDVRDKSAVEIAKWRMR